MSVITFIIDFIIHIDKHLTEIINQYGNLTYIIVFLVIFMETGLVVTPFLPGDSLIFSLGAFSAINAFNFYFMYINLLIAAILGDTLNYFIGYKYGRRIVKSEKIKIIKQEHIDKTEAFFDKHGGKTILIARFMPFIRTFAPFVAGISNMRYRYFVLYNVIGGFLWVSIFYIVGYFFGNISFIQNNFSLVIIGIILVSVIPPFIIKKIQEKKERNLNK